jgi:hypothetical protein
MKKFELTRDKSVTVGGLRRRSRTGPIDSRFTIHGSRLPSPHSSFRLGLALLVLTAMLSVGCLGKRLTKANVDEVEKGMSRKQVESILGPPTSVDSTDLLVTKKVTYTYKQGDELVTIVFFNDEVSSKESNLHD